MLDSAGMVEVAAALPEQIEKAVGAVGDLSGLPDHEAIEHVLVLGMGGSGMAGNVVAAAAAPFMPVPLHVVKSYVVPAYVGRGTLVFAVSFSGDTEETVEAAAEAVDAGARLVAVTSGGLLARMAEEWRVPLLSVPRDIPQPRAALGAMVVPQLLVLEKVGLFPGARRWLEQAIVQLRRRRDQLFTSDARLRSESIASEVAISIGRTIPIVYGAGTVGATAAQRWKTQVNENVKAPAFFAVHPELCHNELAGWGHLGDETRQLLTVVNLRYDGEHPQIARRFAVVTEILREVVADVVDVRAEGDGDLAQLLDLVMLGDAVSLHLADSWVTDPGPVPVLAELKESLRRPGLTSSAAPSLSNEL